MCSTDIAVYPWRKILASGSLLLALSFDLPVVIPGVGKTKEIMAATIAAKIYDSIGPENLVQALRRLKGNHGK